MPRFGAPFYGSRTADIVVAASNSSRIEPADYVCDGVADQVELTAALANGRTVLCLPGTYSLTAGVPLAVARTKMFAYGASFVCGADFVTGVETEQSSAMFLNTAADCAIYGARIAPTNFDGTGTWIRGARFHLKDCILDGTTNRGFFAFLIGDGGDGTIIEDNYIQDWGWCEVARIPSAGAPAVAVSDCQIIGNRFFDMNNWGILLSSGGSLRTKIIGNTVDGVVVEHGFYCQHGDAVIANNVIRNCTGQGIRVTGDNVAITGNNISLCITGISNSDNGSRGATITGNAIRDITGAGIWVRGTNARDTIIANNQIYQAQFGIEIGQGQDLSIIGNLIRRSTNYDIVLAYEGTGNGAERILIANNLLEDLQGVAFFNGSIVLGEADDVRIENNTIRNAIRGVIQGLDLQDYNRILIARNQFHNVTTSIPSVHANWTVRENDGFVTENFGTSAILAGTTSILVTHGLNITPTVDDIRVTFSGNSINDPGNTWVDGITATQFAVNCRNDPGAGGLSFGWKAEVR